VKTSEITADLPLYLSCLDVENRDDVLKIILETYSHTECVQVK
jgi:hypothetical protein